MERPYKPNERKILQLIVAGFVATTAMTFLTYMVNLSGFVAPSFPSLFGAMVSGNGLPDYLTFAWWVGLLWHFVNGTFVFPILGDFLTDRSILPAQKWLKGGVFGFALWILHDLGIAPLAGIGIFWGEAINSEQISFFSFLAFVAYGLVLDGMERVRVVHEVSFLEQQAA